ncbi:hypothetical protein [Proteus mirabilis]|uniref:hypothetical protein n=1 Tax=Proteus mirabilis TaxID=584 RepID=UPI002578C9E2|nr:hypothetical protein [Proteus mirabilis]MDM3782040.1 hypothetical protein [Proteus mirabilis]
MNKTVIALIALAVSFTAGFVAGGIYFDNQAMSKQIAGNQLDEKDVATNIELRKHADNEQQNRLEIYHDAQQHDTIRTDALLDRVLNHFDRMQLSTSTTQTEVASTELRKPKPVNFLDNYEKHLNDMGVKLSVQMKTPEHSTFVFQSWKKRKNSSILTDEKVDRFYNDGIGDGVSDV